MFGVNVGSVVRLVCGEGSCREKYGREIEKERFERGLEEGHYSELHCLVGYCVGQTVCLRGRHAVC